MVGNFQMLNLAVDLKLVTFQKEHYKKLANIQVTQMGAFFQLFISILDSVIAGKRRMVWNRHHRVATSRIDSLHIHSPRDQSPRTR
jgi:hypothetical protein